MSEEQKPTVPTDNTEKNLAEYVESLGGLGPLSPELKARLDAVFKKIKYRRNDIE